MDNTWFRSIVREKFSRGATRGALLALLLSGITACGGGGGGGSGSGNTISGSWQAGVFQPASSFEAKCASPRSGASEITGQPFPDVQGRALDERNWLRSWTHELYLWYDEVPDLNPANYDTLEYFEQMKTTAVSPSGQPKDKFHFTYPTDEWEALSLAGEEAGYGLQWEIVAGEPPRQIVVAYVEPTAPSGTASNVTRGDEVLSIDGIDIDSSVSADIDALNAALFPAAPGETHQFELRGVNGVTRNVSLTSALAQVAAVMNVKMINDAGVVGYLQFNTHSYPSEEELIDAFNTFKAAKGGAGVDDLVLDVRYNGGGLLDVASELAYMIAGQATAGRTFEELQFNDQHPSTDPVTGDPLEPMPFHDKALGFSAAPGAVLPTLNLQRVFVLTGAGTCSASESIINGLRGIDVEVIQIGSTTCGKPYGFYPTDNCGTTYFSIQFRGVNAKNFGDYTDGFSPHNTAGVAGDRVPGCSVADDFQHALGNAAELMLSTALSYRQSGSCPSPTGQSGNSRVRAQSASASPVVAATLQRPFWRQNRIIQ